ncbi:MAG: DUF2161 family putative PD-(D/E)XK-type phosphodiesterase [Desulfobacterales bacterium]
MTERLKESDLYPPIKRFLEFQGYEVKSEIQDCDVLAIRGDEDPVIVELKLSLSLSVLLQAVDRLALSEKVYVGIPRGCAVLRKQRKRVLKLIRMLGLGLMAVDPGEKIGAVDILCDPGEYRPRKSRHRRERLLGEFLQRVGDPNTGGTAMRKGIMTAYRQKAIGIGLFLQKNGPTKASEAAVAVGTPKTRDILYRNVYGWFERVTFGVYQLSPRGEQEIPLWKNGG